MPSPPPTKDQMETTLLDGDMTADDLVDILQHLPFTIGGNGRPVKRVCQISLDRHAALYLIDAIRHRARSGK